MTIDTELAYAIADNKPKPNDSDDKSKADKQCRATGEVSDGTLGRKRKAGQARGPDDYFPKRKKVAYAFKGGADGPTKFLEWQGKQSAYLSSKNIEVARWFSWASMQKGKIEFNSGGGLALSQFSEAVDFDRQIYDALKSATEGPAYKIIRRVETPVEYDLEGSRVGFNANIPLGFEAWRQLHSECWPRSKESGINRMMSSLPVTPARGFADLRCKIHEVE